MATTTNYGWTTPDDTALVKDGAAAIRTLGSSVDTTTKNLNPSTTLGDLEFRSSTSNVNTRIPIGSSGQHLTVVAGVPAWATASDQTPLTTKGDLFTFSTLDARLGVGANNSVLTADSAEATGLKWATPAAPSGANFTLLNSGGTALSGGTTTVSGISGINSIFAIIDTGGASFTQGNFGFRVNGITTNTYTNNYVSISAPSSYSSAYYTGLNQLNTYIKAGQQSTNAGSKAMATILIEGAGTSGFKVYTVIGGATPNGGNEQGMIWGQGVVDTTTITSISAFTDSSFNSGTLYVYGA